MSLPILFPRLRASGKGFDAWVERVLREDSRVGHLTDELLDEGVGLVATAERERILATAVTELRHAWSGLLDEIGDSEAAADALLTGAVAVALREERTLDPRRLDVIEEFPETRVGVKPLALVLDATSLWSAVEGQEAKDAVEALPDELDDEQYARAWDAAFDELARRRWTPAHEERLALLVARVRAQLPAAEFPLASAAVLSACKRFEENSELRAHLGRLLLAGTLGPLRMLDFALAA
jgi:hypothetical protein